MSSPPSPTPQASVGTPKLPRPQIWFILATVGWGSWSQEENQPFPRSSLPWEGAGEGRGAERPQQSLTPALGVPGKQPQPQGRCLLH